MPEIDYVLAIFPQQENISHLNGMDYFGLVVR